MSCWGAERVRWARRFQSTHIPPARDTAASKRMAMTPASGPSWATATANGMATGVLTNATDRLGQSVPGGAISHERRANTGSRAKRSPSCAA